MPRMTIRVWPKEWAGSATGDVLMIHQDIINQAWVNHQLVLSARSVGAVLTVSLFFLLLGDNFGDVFQDRNCSL